MSVECYSSSLRLVLNRLIKIEWILSLSLLLSDLFNSLSVYIYIAYLCCDRLFCVSIESYTFHSLRLVLNLLIKIESLSPSRFFLTSLCSFSVYTLTSVIESLLLQVSVEYYSSSLRLVLNLLTKIELILSPSPLCLLLSDLFL